MPPKGAVTAYFVFTEENRAAVQQELNDAAAAAAAAAEQQAAEGDTGAGAGAAGAAPNKPAAKVSVAVVAKELGARWRSLSDEERDRYKGLAKQRAEAAAAAAAEAAAAAGVDDGDAAGGGGADQHNAAAGDGEAAEEADNTGPALPRGVVKRVMAADPEFKRATADAIWLISAAVEALLGLVAERAARQAMGKRRRTVKLEDLAHVIKYDKRLAEAGLRDVVEDEAMYEAAAAAAAAKATAKGPPKPRGAAAAGGGGAEAGGSPEGGGGGGGGAKGPRAKKAATEDRAQRSISAFFKAG